MKRENDLAEAAIAAAPKASVVEIFRLALDRGANRRADAVEAALTVWRLTLDTRQQRAVSPVWRALLDEVRLAIVAAEAVARRQP